MDGRTTDDKFQKSTPEKKSDSSVAAMWSALLGALLIVSVLFNVCLVTGCTSFTATQAVVPSALDGEVVKELAKSLDNDTSGKTSGKTLVLGEDWLRGRQGMVILVLQPPEELTLEELKKELEIKANKGKSIKVYITPDDITTVD